MAVVDLPFVPTAATHRLVARRRAISSSYLGAVSSLRTQDRLWSGTLQFATFTSRSEVRAWVKFLSELQPDGSGRGTFWAPLYAPDWEALPDDWKAVIPLTNSDGTVSRFALSDGSAGPAAGQSIEFRSVAEPELSQVSAVAGVGELLDRNLVLERAGAAAANWRSPRARAIITNEDPLMLVQLSQVEAQPAALDWVEDRGGLIELLRSPVVPDDEREPINLCTEAGDPILTESGERITV